MILTIETNDKHKVRVDAQDVKASRLLDMIAEGMEGGGGVEEIPLYNVSHRTFLKVAEFMKQHNEDPMRPIPKPLPDDGDLRVQPWYAHYIASLDEGETLYEVLSAANYLDIAPLQELACARIASLIRGKECDELRHIFGLDYDNS